MKNRMWDAQNMTLKRLFWTKSPWGSEVTPVRYVCLHVTCQAALKSASPGCVHGEKMWIDYQSPAKLLQLWAYVLILRVDVGVTLRYAFSDLSKFL